MMALGSKFIANARKPKMSSHAGRVWDVVWVILPNGEEKKGYFDRSYGEYVYFKHSEKWYKTPSENIEPADYKVDLRAVGVEV